MAKIVWTAQARADLFCLHDFLAAHSPEAASGAVKTIREGLLTLKTTPQAGRPVPWLPEGYREWIIPFGNSGYLVLYRLFEDQVVIQALRHGREADYLQ